MNLRIYTLFKVLINTVLTAVAFFLLLRVLFLFFSANLATPFVAWVLTISNFLMTPFAGIAPDLSVSTGVLDISALTTLLVYMVAGYILLSAVDRLARPQITEEEEIAYYHDMESEEDRKHSRRPHPKS